MSRLIRLSPVLLAAFLFQFCSQEDPIAPVSQTVQLTFALDANQITELPAGSTVMVTITTPSGGSVLSDHILAISRSDNGFETEPLELEPREYVITEFLVVHNDLALYVTPKAASEFAQNVVMPLSYAFSLPEDKEVTLGVVPTGSEKAEKFGYRSFRVKDSSQWKIMVFTRENGALQSTAAWVYLIRPGIGYGTQVQPGMNTLAFEGDAEQTYTLLVEKAGYVTYTTDFVYNDIRGNSNKPFKVILDRVPDEGAFTISPPNGQGEFTYRLGLRGSGSLTIDWGDGTVETLNFSPDGTGGDESFLTPLHVYESVSPAYDGWKITVTGDLENVFLLETISVYANDIDLRNLTGLQDITLYGLPINGLLDLSSNVQLESVRLEATYAWEIRLPASHAIHDVFLSDLDGVLSESVVDRFIDNIYKNAVANDITSGTMTILGPFALSGESAEKIRQLVDDYGWQFGDGA